MLDVGFSEIIVVALVALVVLGPDKLRESVRTGALWLGRFRRAFSHIKEEIEREINADEIKAQLHNEGIMADLKKNERVTIDQKEAPHE
jgi:sec-independent protein translocase protein TatB